MRFYAPTNVYVEKNCVENHKKELTALGSRAYIITGRHSAKANGSYADVTAVLDEAGISYVLFDEIEENPSIETVMKASAIGIEEKVDYVIGIGGGSPLDAAKAIALMIANPDEDQSCLYNPKDLASPLPFAAIPTTCGTGSEVTPNAVLTRHDIKTKGSIKYNIYPQLALVDGKYLASASRNLLINTSVDALAHLVESRLHKKANVYNYMFSEYGLKLWSGLIPYLKEEKELDEAAYGQFMLTSTIAGMAIAQTSTSLPHALSYALTYRRNVAHGKACGLFLAAYLEEYAKNRSEDVETVLSLLGFDSVAAFGAFLNSILAAETISAEELDLYTDELVNNAGKLATYPFEISRDAIRTIVEKSLVIA